MVGVARSKACRTCRARRKKCDEQRPKCGLCLRRGLDCVYKQDLNLVFFVAPTTPKKREFHDRNNHDEDSPTSTNTDSPDALPEDLPLACLRTSYRLQVRSCFLEAYFPGDASLPNTTVWLRSANDLSISDQLLGVALDALSFSSIERRTSGPHILPQSQLLYGQAVRGLKIRLSSEDGVLEDTTLATIMVLTAYEAQNATTAGMNGWLPHVKGAAKLVQLRGQKNNSSDFARKLYVGSRLWDLVFAIAHRKAIEPPISYRSDVAESTQSSYTKLFDILITIPAVFEQGDPINRTIHEFTEDQLGSKVSAMAYMCQELESRLNNWYIHLTEVEGNGDEANLFWHQPSTIYSSLPVGDPARVYSTFLQFRDLDIAQQLTLYWTGTLLLYLFMGAVEGTLGLHGPVSLSLCPTEADREALYHKQHELATKITQSLEYFVHADMGLATVDFVGMPINLVYGYWNKLQARELLLFDPIFDRLRPLNTGSAKFIESMKQQGGGRVAFRRMILRQPTADPC